MAIALRVHGAVASVAQEGMRRYFPRSEGGSDDQIVPVEAAAEHSVKLLPNAGLKIYQGAPHGIFNDYADALNVGLLSFLTTDQFPAG